MSFDNMQPGVWCAECGVIAKQRDDFLCDACREDFDLQTTGVHVKRTQTGGAVTIFRHLDREVRTV